MSPSVSERRDAFGRAPIERRWHVWASVAGLVKWRGAFEDREDADAFLWAAISGSLDWQPDLWRLPVPQYFPDYGEGAQFMFAASITITSSGSQARPSDWNDADNTVEGIGGGGSGACGCKQNSNRATGGSGAEYRKLTNYSAPGTFNYTIGTGGTAVPRTTLGITAGNDGGDTILDTTALIAKKGLGGTVLNGSAPTPPAGGTGGTGGTGNDGGGGGSTGSANDCCSGGGGSGGGTGAGNAGATNGSNNTATDGGSGDAGSGGTAGTGSAVNSAGAVTGGNGGNGAELGGSPNGSGGGGGAGMNLGTGTATGGDGGTYGAAGGSSNTKSSGGNSTSGAGQPGIIYMLYTPATANYFLNLNGSMTLTGSVTYH